MSKIDETISAWAEHWVAQGVLALEAEAIAVGTFARGVIYGRLTRLEAVAAAARVIRGLSRIGLLATEADYDMLADAHDALADALDALDD